MGTTEGEGVGLPTGAVGKGDERVVGSEGRTGQQGSDEVCLGYFGVFFVFFLRLLCSASVPAFARRGPHAERRRDRRRQNPAGAGVHFSQIKKP